MNLFSWAWCINAVLYLCHDRRVCGGWGFHWQPVWMGVSTRTVGQHTRRIELDMGWCHQHSTQGRFLTHGDMRGQNTFIYTHTSPRQWTWLMPQSPEPAGCLCQRLQLRHYTLITVVWPRPQTLSNVRTKITQSMTANTVCISVKTIHQQHFYLSSTDKCKSSWNKTWCKFSIAVTSALTKM